MLLEPGSKLLVSHRRLFAEDQPRFFVGHVDEFEEGLVKLTGFSWTRDPRRGFLRKDDRRTKIVSLVSGAVIAYQLPAEVLIEDLEITQPGGQVIVMSDGKKFSMDLAERQT